MWNTGTRSAKIIWNWKEIQNHGKQLKELEVLIWGRENMEYS
jgi:hypothetical protein